MKLKPTERSLQGSGDKSHSWGFTLVEVLAALVFMGILIPVTVRAVQLAGKAGQVGERKAAAARVADRVLNEWMIASGTRQSSDRGTANEGTRTYDWTIRSEPWSEDSMNLVTVRVVYRVQGEEFDVNLSTLLDTTATTN